jgi:hypothetical protein
VASSNTPHTAQGDLMLGNFIDLYPIDPCDKSLVDNDYDDASNALVNLGFIRPQRRK